MRAVGIRVLRFGVEGFRVKGCRGRVLGLGFRDLGMRAVGLGC